MGATHMCREEDQWDHSTCWQQPQRGRPFSSSPAAEQIARHSLLCMGILGHKIIYAQTRENESGKLFSLSVGIQPEKHTDLRASAFREARSDYHLQAGICKAQMRKSRALKVETTSPGSCWIDSEGEAFRI